MICPLPFAMAITAIAPSFADLKDLFDWSRGWILMPLDSYAEEGSTTCHPIQQVEHFARALR